MKKHYISLIVLLMQACVSNSQNSVEHEPSVKHTLAHLKYAINNNDFRVISNLLADDFKYAGMGSPMAQQIFEQVVNQFPDVDTIIVESSNEIGAEKHLSVTINVKNGPERKTIILDQSFKILSADIAEISMGSHGTSKANTEQPDSNANSKKIVIPFRLSKTGHIVIEAQINGRPANFVVDSGTGDQLMLNNAFDSYNSGAALGTPAGVSGEIKGAGSIKIEDFFFGGIRLTNLDALTADLTHLGKNMEIEDFGGTIGYGVLKNYVVEFDYKKSQLTLWTDSKSFWSSHIKSEINVMPLNMAFHIPVINAKIGGKEVRLGIDCGAQGNMLELKWKDLLKGNYNNIREDKLVGAEKNAVTVSKVSMQNFELDGRNFETDFVFGQLFGGHHQVNLVDGLVGYPFLSYQKTAINFIDNEMYFLD